MAVQGRNFVAAFGLGLTLCLMQQPLVAWAAMTMEETCALYPGDYIADPSDCQGWGYCKDNKLLATGKCADGLLYDSTNAICNYADQVKCNVNITTMCTGLNAVYKADPDNCQNYCYCVNGVTECAKCPENQSFDPTTSECVWNSKNENCVADSPCRLVPSYKFIADPNVCGGWLMCQNGIGKGGTCETGYNFNPSTGYCDPNYNLDCEDDGVVTVTGLCTSSGATATDIKYVSDGQTCGGYVVCTSTSGGSWQKCPLGTHFDPKGGVTETGACVTPYTYACPYDRCDNLNLTFVTYVGPVTGTGETASADTADLTCEKYITCSNQVTVESTEDGQECSDLNKTYPYFDESIGGCVDKAPDQEICKNAPTEE